MFDCMDMAWSNFAGNYLVILPLQTREINVNAFGDDYVSFVPMYLSFSPDGKRILMSTGECSCKCELVVIRLKENTQDAEKQLKCKY